MPTSSTLLWVNKTSNSTSLSNCKNEKDASRQIRSHAVTAGHKSSRIKRPIKRTSRKPHWVRTKDVTIPAADIIQPIQSKKENSDLIRRDEVHISQRDNATSVSQTSTDATPNSIPTSTSRPHNILILPPLTPHLTPSTHPVPFPPSALSILHYFSQTWVNTAFKLPGCIGFPQPPILETTITTLLQHTLQNAISAYSLLAAASARRAYLTPHSSPGNDSRREAHGYAARAMNGLRHRLQPISINSQRLSEDDVTSIIFLSAYAVFCEDEGGAEKHLAAVRRLYKREIRNGWVERLRGNLEVLVARSLGEGGKGMKGKITGFTG